MSTKVPKQLPKMQRNPKQYLNQTEVSCEAGTDTQTALASKADALLADPNNSGLILASHCSRTAITHNASEHDPHSFRHGNYLGYHVTIDAKHTMTPKPAHQDRPPSRTTAPVWGCVWVVRRESPADGDTAGVLGIALDRAEVLFGGTVLEDSREHFFSFLG